APARERNVGEPPRGRTGLQASGLAVDRLDLGDRSAALLDDDVLPPLDSPEMLGELRFELGDADRFHDHILVMSGPFANSSRPGIPGRPALNQISWSRVREWSTRRIIVFLARAAAEQLGVRLPVTAVVDELLTAVAAKGA